MTVEISRSSASKAVSPCPAKFNFLATPGSELIGPLAFPCPIGLFACAGDLPGNVPG
jgi:hypothetical protein